MPTKVLVLGASGMLGHTLIRVLAEDGTLDVWGTARSMSAVERLPTAIRERTLVLEDLGRAGAVLSALSEIRPDVVINCVGLVKQSADSNSPYAAYSINAILPHRLAALCIGKARVIQISTDCVFSGERGNYSEADNPDARDVYGLSKRLGELGLPRTATLRTSIIGHELRARHGLLEWFLAQRGAVRGFRRAVFSGLTTVELSRVLRDHVIPNESLTGLYHVAAQPITKFDLLSLINQRYGRGLVVEPDDSLVIDRSLNGAKFSSATGYVAPEWPELIDTMYRHHSSNAR